MAIPNGLCLPTSENPMKFPIWCVLAKLTARPRNDSEPRPLGTTKDKIIYETTFKLYGRLYK